MLNPGAPKCDQDMHKCISVSYNICHNVKTLTSLAICYGGGGRGGRGGGWW